MCNAPVKMSPARCTVRSYAIQWMLSTFPPLLTQAHGLMCLLQIVLTVHLMTLFYASLFMSLFGRIIEVLASADLEEVCCLRVLLFALSLCHNYQYKYCSRWLMV